MSCHSCQTQSTSSPCTCTSPEICACETPIYAECLTYNGDTLSCLNIVAGDTGDEILASIDTAFCAIVQQVAECCTANTDDLNCDLLTP